MIAAAVSAIIEILLLMGLTVHWRAVRVDLIKPFKAHMCMPWDKFVIEKDDENRKHCPATLKEKNEKQTNSTRCYGLFTDVMDGLITKVINSVKYNHILMFFKYSYPKTIVFDSNLDLGASFS